ncbi:hypothetical protein BaRGS_00015441 [Batillaria attramentaria]|uniref:C2H2-type domain-containing protein n=1 Tax=Batillaria attramentaria TaxID=370345 RepID=A0ABD0L2F4_9CAEN
MAEEENVQSAVQHILKALSNGGPCPDQVVSSSAIDRQEHASKPSKSETVDVAVTGNTSVSVVDVTDTSEWQDERAEKGAEENEQEQKPGQAGACKEMDVHLHEHVTPVEHDSTAGAEGTHEEEGGQLSAETSVQGSKMHLCRLCGAVLDSSQDLLQHAQQHLMNEDVSALTCRVCAVTFPTPSHLVQHLQAHSVMELVTSTSGADNEQGEGQEIACTQCGDKFTSSQLLYQHVLTDHRTTENLHCPLCSQKFRPGGSAAYLIHLKRHVAEPAVACNRCGKKFRTEHCLASHMLCHEPRQKHLCPFCGKSYVQKIFYDRHMKSHEEFAETGGSVDDNVDDLPPETTETTGKHVCKICGKVQRTKGHLGMHMKYHLKYGPVLQKLCCSTCNLTFTNKTEQKKHMAVHKQQKKAAGGNKCPVCGARFPTCTLKQSHVFREHPDYKPFKCSKCEKTYRSNFDRYRHELTHEGKRAYQCPHCPRQLWSVDNLKQHIIVIHSGLERKKDVPCEVCGRLFHSKRRVQMHIRCAHEAKRFKCSYCPKMLKNKSGLKAHESIHSGELPFECQECDAKFRLRGDLTKHTYKVHEVTGRNWNCQDCNASFRIKNELAAHVRKVHWLCFQCVERFPNRDAAKKHRCKLYRADMYLKKNSSADSQGPAVKDTGSDSSAESAASRDALLQIVLAAQSLDQGSAPPAAAQLEGAQSSSVEVAYTLTHESSDARSATVKLPRFRHIRREKNKLPQRKIYSPLIPPIQDEHSNLTSSAHEVVGADSSISTALAASITPAPQESIDRPRTRSVTSKSPQGEAVVCEALPQAVEQENMSVPSTPTTTDAGKSLCQAGASMSISSPFKAPLPPESLFAADLVVIQDHNYNGVLPLVLEVDEASQSVLLKELTTEEPLAGTSKPAFTEHAYPTDRLHPGAEIPLDDFFACLNEHENEMSEAGSGRNADSLGTPRVTEKKNTGTKRMRPKLEQKRQSRKKTKSAAENDVQPVAPDEDSDVLHPTDGAECGLFIERDGVSGEENRVSHPGNSAESGVFIKVEGSGEFHGAGMKENVDKAGVSRETYNGKDGIAVKQEQEETVCRRDDMKSVVLSDDDASERDTPEADDFEANTNSLTSNKKEENSQLAKQPVVLKLTKAGMPCNQKQGQSLGTGSSTTSSNSKPSPTPVPPPQCVGCEICGKIFHSCNTLQAHLQNLHKCDETYSCQHCLYVTTSFSRLTVHFEQHAMAYPLSNGVSTTGSGDVIGTTQTVGPLWEAAFTSKERNCTVFIALTAGNNSQKSHAGNSSGGKRKPSIERPLRTRRQSEVKEKIKVIL